MSLGGNIKLRGQNASAHSADHTVGKSGLVAGRLFTLNRFLGMSERLEAESQEEVAELKRRVTLKRKIAEKIIIRGFERKCR